jgi:poly-gamma-glutamate capsule biosynthesis protein CapA/YwtB (metallophosphatase superfamily)
VRRGVIAWFLLLLLDAAALPAQSSSSSAASPARTLRLSFIGDIMAHDVNYTMADYADIWTRVAPLLQADDLTLANLEFPVDPTSPLSTYPLFNGPPAYVRAALDAGVDGFSLANNHAFDGGEEGIFQTLRSIESLRSGPRPVWASGIRGNPAAPFTPLVFTIHGVRVGLLAASQFLNVPDGGRYVQVVDWHSPDAVDGFVSAVRAARARVDLLIVSYHGDDEYVQRPAPGKVLFFQRLVEAGAQIVFSHHPHVVQGFALPPVPGGRGLVMYSMGNFISGMTWFLDPAAPDARTAATGETYIMQATVLCPPGGACTVQSVKAVPVANYRNARDEIVVAPLRDLADGTVTLAAAWKTFYQRRLGGMERFLSAFGDGKAGEP